MDEFSVRFAMGTFYDNITPRIRQEVADSRMIQEDRHAMANLPTKGSASKIHLLNNIRFNHNQSLMVHRKNSSHFIPSAFANLRKEYPKFTA